MAKQLLGIKVQYEFVDGAHFFTSPDVKGLCVASTDFAVAYNEVAIQLNELFQHQVGEHRNFQPAVPLEDLLKALKALSKVETGPDIKALAAIDWKMNQGIAAE